MKEEQTHLSRCGKYYCTLCDYHKGTIVEAARNLLFFAEKYGSLKLIVEGNKACDFDEFMKGLRWVASHEKPCRGCRSGGGWSWWKDCPVRDCTAQKGVDFCFQCKDFPCERLATGSLLERKRAIIEANNQIKTMGTEKYSMKLKERYGRT